MMTCESNKDFTLKNIQEYCEEYARLGIDNVFEFLCPKIVEISKDGGDYIECTLPLCAFRLVKSYFEHLYFTIEVTNKMYHKNKTLITFRIKW